MKKFLFPVLLLIGCFVGLSMTSCTSRGSDEDDLSYETRSYIIGISQWEAKLVKRADGTWADDPFHEGKQFTINFKDHIDGKASNPCPFETWEFIGQTDIQKREEKHFSGTYSVSNKTVTCTVDGKQHLRFIVTKMEESQLGGTVTFFDDNVTFDVIMEPTW